MSGVVASAVAGVAATVTLFVPAVSADDRPFDVVELAGHGRTVAAELADLDGDGRTDVLQIAYVGQPPDERRLIRVFFQQADGRFADKPWTRLKIAVPLSFSTERTRGFLPTTRADLDGDGYKELLTSGGGERIEVFRGGDPPKYSRPVTTQKLDTAGRLRTGDIDGDGRIDLLLHDHSVVDGKIRILRNRDCLRSTDAGCPEPRQPILRAP